MWQKVTMDVAVKWQGNDQMLREFPRGPINTSHAPTDSGTPMVFAPVIGTRPTLGIGIRHIWVKCHTSCVWDPGDDETRIVQGKVPGRIGIVASHLAKSASSSTE